MLIYGTRTMNKFLSTVAAAAIAGGLFAGTARAADEEILKIDSRPGVTVGIVVTQPPAPAKAAAILLIGGNGKLKLWKGEGLQSNNFLARSRGLFAARGVLTVVVDVPSDRRREGMDDFRGTDEHREDIAAVVKWLRGRTKVPLWLIGTSRGTVSLSHIAGKLPIDGVVYTSSVTKVSRRRPPTALDGAIESITVPTLLVHHEADDCVVTPASGVSSIADRLTKSPKVETRMFSGGTSSDKRACGAISAHGFLGIEDKVVGAIVDWMVANAPR